MTKHLLYTRDAEWSGSNALAGMRCVLVDHYEPADAMLDFIAREARLASHFARLALELE